MASLFQMKSQQAALSSQSTWRYTWLPVNANYHKPRIIQPTANSVRPRFLHNDNYNMRSLQKSDKYLKIQLKPYAFFCMQKNAKQDLAIKNIVIMKRITLTCVWIIFILYGNQDLLALILAVYNSECWYNSFITLWYHDLVIYYDSCDLPELLIVIDVNIVSNDWTGCLNIPKIMWIMWLIMIDSSHAQFLKQLLRTLNDPERHWFSLVTWPTDNLCSVDERRS